MRAKAESAEDVADSSRLMTLEAVGFCMTLAALRRELAAALHQPPQLISRHYLYTLTMLRLRVAGRPSDHRASAALCL
jgi:hypothetical protein